MSLNRKRIARLLLVTPLLAVLILTGTIGSASAASHHLAQATQIPGHVLPDPIQIPETFPRYPTPPPLVEVPIPATGSGETVTSERTAEDWKKWPVFPEISNEMVRLYNQGLRLGTDPHAFSIVGDCQSQPEVFLGVFDTEPWRLGSLSADLRETIDHYSGQFDRGSPTIRDGITAGAVIWTAWATRYDGGRVCEEGETPLTCELRINNPSIVFIHIGTHWEARNHRYLTQIVETIKEHGAIPVMVTKADNREGDERINLETVRVAQEQGIPVWNFWASVQHTPNNGLEDDSVMYLNEEAVEIHRYSALQVLDIIRKAVQ
jgi:hypothetical protein